MPRPVKVLVLAVIAAGAAVLAAAWWWRPGGRSRNGAFVALLAAGILLAELYPVRLPGIGAETSFSASFSFALLVTHGTAVAVPVTVLCLLAADAIRRRAAVKVLYNGAQYGISWLVAGSSTACSPVRRGSRPPGRRSSSRWCPPPSCSRSSTPRWPCSRRRCSGASRSGAAVPTRHRSSPSPRSCWSRSRRSSWPSAARDLLLVPLLGLPLAGIQLGSRQALLVEAQARVDSLTGVASRHAVEQALARRLADRRTRRRWSCSTSSGSRTSTTRSATAPAMRCCAPSRSG